jgi:uncharacterized tellurite resistance protein B-like protein
MSELEKIEDFSLLLLLHMARVDGSLHPNERETINDRMQEIFPSYASEERLQSMEEAYKKLGDARVEELLLASLTRFAATTMETRKQIFAALFDIINANGRVDTQETHTLGVFRKWLLA